VQRFAPLHFTQLRAASACCWQHQDVTCCAAASSTSIYLLYWHKSTNTDAEGAGRRPAARAAPCL
jgi:hypothetical protein